jgi:CubicO group peptidase (beta-lactamase class C family)
MLSNRKLLVILLIVILAVSVAATIIMTGHVGSPDQSGYSEAIVTARTEIWKDINSGKASSGTVAIMDNGKIVYSEGFGMADRENSIPVTTTTMFNIGSISKTYCTAAVMLLVDDGKVKLDENVTTYLPDFKMADPRYQDITVRMLLDHTSGLPGTVEANDLGYAYNPSFYSEVYTALSTAHLKAAPGSMGPYCNDGFTLAEMLVANVSGENYTDFLSQRIFKPLSLDHTGVSVGLETGKDVAAYYEADTGKKVPAKFSQS